MANKKQKTTVIKMYNNAVELAGKKLEKANKQALNTTEEIALEAIEIAGEWQKVAHKALKGGLQLAGNQQNLMFDTLEAVKGQFIHGKKRFSKLLA